MMECLNRKIKYAGRGKNHSGQGNFMTVKVFWIKCLKFVRENILPENLKRNVENQGLLEKIQIG
jgi:hypothetical protein